jgi:hypothetical protein
MNVVDVGTVFRNGGKRVVLGKRYANQRENRQKTHKKLSKSHGLNPFSFCFCPKTIQKRYVLTDETGGI